MSPEDVKPEWVEKAARAIHEARCCPLDQDSDCYGERLYVESDQARHALAAVLPLALAEVERERDEARAEAAGYWRYAVSLGQSARRILSSQQAIAAANRDIKEHG
jgi:hypothetical protein